MQPAQSEPQDLADEELAEITGEEERCLGRVEKHIATTKIATLTQVNYDQDLIALRDQIAEARLEDVPPLIQEMERLQQVANRRAEVKEGAVDAASPYFGRMVLEEGVRKREVLIGRGTYLDPRTGIRIVDWRDAPVSRLYYRYDEGDDYEENFGGKDVAGTVVTRRSLAITDSTLRRIVAPQGTFLKRGETWARAGASATRLRGGMGSADRPDHYHKPGKLGVGRDGDGRADKFLPEIAALIDPRQFDLITKPSSGLIVIQGGAGSGKTTIGLHRMAYLAFEDPKRFRPDKMLVVVFNEALARYISRVLPALGVEGVPVTTYAAWARKLRQVHLPRVPRKISDETPASVTRAKKHPAMLRYLDTHVAKLAVRVERALTQALGEIPGKEDALARFAQSAKKPLAVRLDRLLAWATGEEEGTPPALPVRHAVERITAEIRSDARDVFGALAELLTDEAATRANFEEHAPGEFSAQELHEIHTWCTGRFNAALAEMDQRVEEREERTEKPSDADARGRREEAAEAVNEAGVKLQARRRASDDDEDDGPDEDVSHIGIDGRDEHEEARATSDAEDDTLLLRLWQRLRGPLRRPGGKGKAGSKEPLRYEHVLIDEAQDLSPVELAVVVEATTPQRSVTLAGDVAQRLLMDNGFVSWSATLQDLGLAGTTVEPLEVSYRSTKEIIDFAAHVLGPLAASPGKPTRAGAPVELFRFAHSGDAVGFLAEALRELVRAEPLASIAVVSRYPEQADLYYRGLANAEVPNLRRIAEQDFPFKPGIDVTDVRQVKGLEFDYVVLLEASEASYPAQDEARHLMHIAATRAAHQLWVTCTGTPSPLLPEDLRARGY